MRTPADDTGESVALTLAGGALGVALAEAGIGLLLRIAPPSLPRLGVGLLASYVPARRAAALDPTTAPRVE